MMMTTVLARTIELTRAETRGHAVPFYVVDCPRCGAKASVSLSDRGFKCDEGRGGCEWFDTDLRVIAAYVLASKGLSEADIVRALG